MATKQVNVELPEPLSRRIKADAALLGISLSEYSRVALELFLAKPVANRRVNCSDAKRKISGRNCKV